MYSEKCAVFGVYGKGLDASRLSYFGLFALQHRGQEASGISTSDGKTIRTYKDNGLVAQVYSESILRKLPGYMAIGHNRYSTSGGTLSDHSQPVASRNEIVSLVHNGNLPDTRKLSRFLSSQGIFTKGSNDSELMQMVIRFYLVKGLTLEESIRISYPLFTGAYSLLIMTKNKIAAVRDPYGIRPLSIGKLNGGFVFSSETCAIDTVSGEYLRDVNPGEMVIVDKDGMRSYQLDTPTQMLDIFEFVYFSRPDSILLGKRVYDVRKNLGKYLAKEHPLSADVVIPVPDSSIPAAIGYSKALNIPFEFGLVKNRYIGRTFIMPDQRMREHGVEMKLNPIKEVIEGKRVVVIDDSIVRGTTSKKIIAMLRKVGAKEVHMLSSCPPVKYPDFYGIDTPKQNELISAQMSTSEIKKLINADTLHFLTYKNLIKATGLSESVFCTSCFTGDYPIDIGKNKKQIKKV